MTSPFEIYMLSAVTVAVWFALVWWNRRDAEK